MLTDSKTHLGLLSLLIFHYNQYFIIIQYLLWYKWSNIHSSDIPHCYVFLLSTLFTGKKATGLYISVFWEPTHPSRLIQVLSPLRNLSDSPNLVSYLIHMKIYNISSPQWPRYSLSTRCLACKIAWDPESYALAPRDPSMHCLVTACLVIMALQHYGHWIFII